MFDKSLYFMHTFDAKMHHFLYHSLINISHDEINLNDSVQNKKCSHNLGRWNFTIKDKDYSCGVYQTLEMIRKTLLNALQNNKDSVDLEYIPIKNNPEECRIHVSENRENPSKIDPEDREKLPAKYEDHQICKCDPKISKSLFIKIIKPILEDIFKKNTPQMTIHVRENK